MAGPGLCVGLLGLNPGSQEKGQQVGSLRPEPASLSTWLPASVLLGAKRDHAHLRHD